MRLRTHIFLSVFIASIVPLVVLALGATYYTEYSYRRDAQKDILTSLDSISADMQRELQDARNLVKGMALSPALQKLLPLLHAAAGNAPLKNSAQLRDNANAYFEGFQTIISGVFYLRVLDNNGDTLVKVSHLKRSQPQYDNLNGLRYVEHQLTSPDFSDLLTSLPPGEVSMVSLPHHASQPTLTPALPLLDFVVPLYYENQFVGAIAMTLTGDMLDRILNTAPQLYHGNLRVVENNPDEELRHGLVLYDRSQNLFLAQIRPDLHRLDAEKPHPLFSNTPLQPEGVMESQDRTSQIYYVEIYPYPNRLISWILTLDVNTGVIIEPFNSIRTIIWLIVAGSLLVSLLLTGFGVRHIAMPVCRLAAQLKSYADGQHQQRAGTQQSIDEVRALSSAFNYMADTLETAEQERDRAQHMMLQSNKLASIGQMAAGIGHELNNPLNNILSYAKLASRSLSSDQSMNEQTRGQLDSDLQALRDEALRASEIIRGILNFARQVPPQYTRFSVHEWIEKSISLVNQTARSKHIIIDTDYAGTDNIEGDPAQLQQVMINLLLNAIQASDDNATIYIHASSDEQYIRVSVQDHGHGISEEALDRIYDPFFTTKKEGDGSGLGLSISLGIIEFHNGSLEIRNNPHGGVTAMITLPILKGGSEQQDNGQ